MSESNNNDKKTKDGAALVVGGLFILALVFAAYNYFNNANSSNNTGSENKSIIERVKDVFNSDDDKEGSLNGNGAMDSLNEPEKISSTEETMIISEWVANDYAQGDITGNTYTVVWGDTLWEIAEAVYGNGSEWTRILEANSSDIGYLPGGQQALIVPGQVLVIP